MITMTFHPEAALRGIDALIGALDGRTRGLDKLGEIVAEDMRGYVDAGGVTNSGPHYPHGDIKKWAPTHPRWVKLQGKSHNRPLFNTGAFRDSFTYHVEPGLFGGRVVVGSTFIGAWRFHHGDAKIYGGPGPGFRRMFFDDNGNMRMLRVRPKIQERPFLILFRSQAINWLGQLVREVWHG